MVCEESKWNPSPHFLSKYLYMAWGLDQDINCDVYWTQNLQIDEVMRLVIGSSHDYVAFKFMVGRQALSL